MGYPGGYRQQTLGSAAVDDGYGPPVIVSRSSRSSRRREFPDIEKPEALGVTLFRAGTEIYIKMGEMAHPKRDGYCWMLRRVNIMGTRHLDL